MTDREVIVRALIVICGAPAYAVIQLWPLRWLHRSPRWLWRWAWEYAHLDEITAAKEPTDGR